MKLRSILSAVLLAAASLSWAQSPDYIFYFIGDGMGLSPVNAAEYYNRNILGSDKPLNMMTMDVCGWARTFSANDDVTDSAAAGTALATGNKTNNGMIGVTPDETPVTPIANTLAKMGYGIGIATSVAPDDATPAAFYAHVKNRGMFYEIGSQMASNDYLFMAGAGLRGLEKDGKATDLLDQFKKNKVQIVAGPDGIKDINSKKVLLLGPAGAVYSNDIGYAIDSVPGGLTLPVITEACLNHLEKYSPKKFFMMIEGGAIDHALHGNDGGTAIKEILEFDKCIAMALEFYRQHPDKTLIVVTADHDTGGMSFIHGSNGGLKNVYYLTQSKDAFNNYCRGLIKSKANFSWDDMKQYLSEHFGFFTNIKLNEDQENKLKALFDDTFEKRNSADQQTLYNSFNQFSVAVYDIFNKATGLAFTTGSHSANPVPVFAIGVGANQLRGYNDNTNIPQAILRAAEGKAVPQFRQGGQGGRQGMGGQRQRRGNGGGRGNF